MLDLDLALPKLDSASPEVDWAAPELKRLFDPGGGYRDS